MPSISVPVFHLHGEARAMDKEEGGRGEAKRSEGVRGGPGLNHLFFVDDLLLFAEAQEDQLMCLKEGFNLFCRCSGQRINYQKSSMFFSSNVHGDVAQQLSGMMGIPLKKDIGRYLGHYIVEKGSHKEWHKELLLRIHKRVASWKLHCLSRAGRLTLAQSVLGSLLMFNMQLEHLPAWVHKEIDKAVRGCIWWSAEERRGVHLMDWMTMCRPKRCGGANLRMAKDMNQAMLAKLAWRVLTCSGEL